MNIIYNSALGEFWTMHYFEYYPPSVMIAAANDCFGYSPSHESAITIDHWQAYVSNDGPESAPSSSLFTTEATHKPRDKDFEAKVKAAAVEYRQRERDFMLGLDEQDRSVMVTSYLGPEISNTESAMVRNAFLIGPAWGRLGPVPELEIAHALGYPVAEDAVTDRHIVIYNDNAEMREVAPPGSGELHSVRVLSFYCTSTEFENRDRILDHFKKYKELATQVGADLKFVPIGKLPEAREVLEKIMTRLTLQDVDEEVKEEVAEESEREGSRSGV
ncbi:hypothetical protein DL769_000335 [Monosporascus sp. CRB-8-3]|nr:hypothetical protein DL769_000335 [Monosporascus sp. CRB-8-3]